MFSRSRRKKIKEKLDFKFQFHATQVPCASWDRLAVSMVSLDSGRVVGRTHKASTLNARCQWPDALAETVKLFRDTKTLEYDEKLFKFIVAKGFARSCMLGEVIINIAEFVSASPPVTLILPLRLCYAGTVLHVTIECLTPKCIDKPSYSKAEPKVSKDGYASDGEPQLYASAASRSSPVHRLLRTFSVGSHRPIATNGAGECSTIQPNSPRNKDAPGVGCKVYNNPCAYSVEDNFSQAIYTTKATNDEKFKLLVSAFAEDVRNMRLVLRDLSVQSQQLDCGSQLVEDLRTVAHTSQALFDQLEAGRGLHDEHVELSPQRDCFGLEETQRRTITELESNLMKCTQELERMQNSSQQLETRTAALKLENRQLEETAQEQKLKLQNCELESKSRVRKVMSLEAEMKVLEEEKEAAVLENYVGENLVRDLCKQVREFVYKTKPGTGPRLINSDCQSTDRSPDFIGQVKELRSLFSDLLKSREKQATELEKKYNELEDRVTMQNEKAMANISFLDEQFGQLSKESDKLIGICNEEAERLQRKIEDEHQEIQHKGFLQVAFEENACEILYLRNELRKLEEQVAAMERNTTLAAAQLELDGNSSRSAESTLTLSFGGQFANDEVGPEDEAVKIEVASLLDALRTLTSQKLELEDDFTKLTRQVTNVEQDFQRATTLVVEALRRSEALVKDEHDKLRAELEEVQSNLKLEKTMLEKMFGDRHIKLQYQLAASERFVSQLQTELELCKSQKVNLYIYFTVVLLFSILQAKVGITPAYSEYRERESTLRERLMKLQNERAEKDAAYERLTKENEELRSKLGDWDTNKEEPTSRIRALEVEAERLLEMVSLKEAEASGKQLELEVLRQELQQKESYLWGRIELLERSNEQLASQQVDFDLDQLKNELMRLQTLNSELTLREHELSTKLSTSDLLHLELQRLHEENDQLKHKYSKLRECSQWSDTAERLMTLEAEWADALETNKMYKLQLQNIMTSKNPHADNMEDIIGDLVSFKQRASFLEAELTELQDRYLKMSMKFAELQLEREELLIMVKSLRSSR